MRLYAAVISVVGQQTTTSSTTLSPRKIRRATGFHRLELVATLFTVCVTQHVAQIAQWHLFLFCIFSPRKLECGNVDACRGQIHKTGTPAHAIRHPTPNSAARFHVANIPFPPQTPVIGPAIAATSSSTQPSPPTPPPWIAS